ncbi:RagB/SusD family nutrient uptake outer membrane protein [soil metagenome]
MKNSIKSVVLIAILFAAFSCTNLDEQLRNSFTKVPAINNQGVGTKNNVNKPTPSDGLAGAFGKLSSGTAGNGGFFQASELSSDEVVIGQKGGDWFDGGVYIKAHKHDFSPQTVSINDAWKDAYGGILQCNELLATSLPVAKQAQLKTLRAYFYWRLLDMFGNVKLVVSTTVSPAQSTRAQVFSFIESELLAAIPNLPTGLQEYGRVSQGAARALLTRLYLNAEVYSGSPRLADAVIQADFVINSGVYALWPVYSEIFDAKNVENKEHIFVYPFDEATGPGMSIAQMTLHYPSQLTYKLASQPWNGYQTMEAFYNSYEVADKRRTNNFIVGPQFDTNGAPILDLAFDKADEDGAPINYTPKINELAPNASRQSGARLGKFNFKIGQTNDMDNDYPLLRYSEVILNKAEALWRINNADGTALILVNQIRSRAGVAPYASLSAGNFLAERGRELFIEGLRRSDLIRFGAWGNAWWEKPAHASNDYRILMAIPLEQLQVDATLTQNPGY